MGNDQYEALAISYLLLSILVPYLWVNSTKSFHLVVRLYFKYTSSFINWSSNINRNIPGIFLVHLTLTFSFHQLSGIACLWATPASCGRNCRILQKVRNNHTDVCFVYQLEDPYCFFGKKPVGTFSHPPLPSGFVVTFASGCNMQLSGDGLVGRQNPPKSTK